MIRRMTMAAALVLAGRAGADAPWQVEALGQIVQEMTCQEAMLALDPDTGEDAMRMVLRAAMVGAAASQTRDHSHPEEFGTVLRYTESMVFVACTINGDRTFRSALRAAAPAR